VTLRKETVYLAPLGTEDLPILWRWINDRDLVLFNSPYRPVSEAQHGEWFERMSRASDAVTFGIRLIDGDRLIGTTQLTGIHPVHRSAELQIRIADPADRGRGLGTEAVTLLLDLAFRDLNLNRVGLHVFAANAAAVRAYEKCGFVREGLLRQAAHIDGQYVDVAVLGVLRSEHERRAQADS
jgi:RimJ/RimL family protein N-acetyltransferase